MPSSENIEHQVNLLNIYRGSVEHYLRQRAELGNITPTGILNGLTSARAEIYSIKQILAAWNYPVADLPGIDYDVSQTVTLTIDIEIYNRIRAIVSNYGIELPEV